MILPLSRIKKIDGTNLLPDTLATAQRRIADMFNYNPTSKIVEVTLPSDYATDSRWDSASKTFSLLSSDVISMSLRAEEIQSRGANLEDPYIVDMREGELVLEANSRMKFIQNSSNPECTINMTAFTIRRESDSKMLNTFVDNSNGAITVNAGQPIVANISVPASTLAGLASKEDAKIINNNVITSSKFNTAKEVIL